MSEAKHTPGPWKIIGKYGAIVADADTGCDDAQSVKDYGGHLVCESVMRTPNARLIAAAPDLLAACRALYAVSPDCPYNSEKCAEIMAEAGWNPEDHADEPWDEYADRIAKAAIAKAKGACP